MNLTVKSLKTFHCQVLIYIIEKDILILTVLRTGTHSNLF